MSATEKRCVRCGQLKPVSEFGTLRRRNDGLNIYCRPCMRGILLESKLFGEPPESTRLGVDILRRHGIWTGPGAANGCPYVDCVAWGVPVEFKGARPCRISAQGAVCFSWGKTRLQRELGIRGVVMLIGVMPDGTVRTWLLPSTNELVTRGSRIVVSIDSHDPRSDWPKLQPYENAFYLIEQARQQLSATLVGVPVPTFSL